MILLCQKNTLRQVLSNKPNFQVGFSCFVRRVQRKDTVCGEDQRGVCMQLLTQIPNIKSQRQEQRPKRPQRTEKEADRKSRDDRDNAATFHSQRGITADVALRFIPFFSLPHIFLFSHSPFFLLSSIDHRIGLKAVPG